MIDRGVLFNAIFAYYFNFHRRKFVNRAQLRLSSEESVCVTASILYRDHNREKFLYKKSSRSNTIASDQFQVLLAKPRLSKTIAIDSR